nr:hp [Calliteara abietis nucleopolyhedrovirus]
MTTLNVKYLEFGDVSLDLRHVAFPCSAPDDGSEFIVFLNVHKAFFSNFKLVCDLSLETLTQYIYENVKYTLKGVLQACILNYSRFVYNYHDRNKSIVIELDSNARIIVAAVIRFDEQYHQRVSGYLDFEKRHTPQEKRVFLSDQERAELDKTCEIKLLSLDAD